MQHGSPNAQIDAPSIMNTATIFGKLSTDALAIIVKVIYRRLAETVYEEASPFDGPMPDEAQRCEQVGLIALLFCEDSPFRAAAATLVWTIELCWSHPRTVICPIDWDLNIGPDLFESERNKWSWEEACFRRVGPMCAR